jgi:hypothetical protein
MSRRFLLGCGIFTGLAFCTQVFAAEGKIDMTGCYSSPIRLIQQCDGITAGNYDLTGMMPGQEGTPIYRLSGRCLGQFNVIKGGQNESGSCQFWNADGDKIFSVYERKDDPARTEGTWRVVQATGKLEGMTWEANSCL